MRVPNRRLQVFVSSTFTDLEIERQAAVEAIRVAGHIPAGMELFRAEDKKQMAVIREWIDDSDVFVLILAGRYGSVEKDAGKSYTRLEYEHALRTDKTVLSMVMTDAELDARSARDFKKYRGEDHGAELRAFRTEVMTTKMVDFFANTDELKWKLAEALRVAERNPDLIGWVRRTEVVDTAAVLNQMTALTQENQLLRAEIEAIRRIPATDANSIPSRARRVRYIPGIQTKELCPLIPLSYVDWFRLCGEVFSASSPSTRDFHEKTASSLFPGINLFREGRAYFDEFEWACDAAIAEFRLYGWLEDSGDWWKVKLTASGRKVFLAVE